MTTMLELTHAELDKLDALTPKLNPITQQVVNAIPFTTVTERMKATVAVSQLMTFASQFKRNIELWDETLVPINSISFIIAGSGAGKDSAVNSARKCFAPGYKMIESTREAQARAEAIGAATQKGEDLPTEYDVYKAYLPPIPPIDIMPTTEPGLIQHINDIGNLKLSAGYLYSGEFSDELAYNPDMISNIKVISETYDIGVKQAKYTKGAEFRSSAISGEPVSALFVGSPGHILYDESTKKKFNVAFMSKLARRSWFCYAPEVLPEPEFDSIHEMIEYEESIKAKSKQASKMMQEQIIEITKFGIDSANCPITVSQEVYELFVVYKRYNSELVNSLPNQDSTYALIRRHLQWKALKLAGAYALLDLSDQIEAKHYIQAMQFCELLDKDMEIFEYDLNKSYHERFSDYIRTLVNKDGKAIMSIHDLKKHGFLSTLSKQKLQELVTLCAGYDTTGIYSIINDGGAIQYEPIIRTDEIHISFKSINTEALDTAVRSNNSTRIATAKRSIAVTTASGFDVASTTFSELADLLTHSYAYTPFRLRDGVRGKDNIIGNTKWLVLDVDNTPISAEETHFMLSDINHHVALTSDPNNQYKYRVLIELDSPVELDASTWKQFYLLIAQDLGLRVDPLPQSQIFYSYPDRPVYSVTDAEPISTRNYVMEAIELVSNKSSADITQLSNSEKRSQLSDKLNTFGYAFEAPYGQASRRVIQAIYHLRDLGGSKQDAIDLFNEIQEYWVDPFDDERKQSFLTQIEGLF